MTAAVTVFDLITHNSHFLYFDIFDFTFPSGQRMLNVLSVGNPRISRSSWIRKVKVDSILPRKNLEKKLKQCLLILPYLKLKYFNYWEVNVIKMWYSTIFHNPHNQLLINFQFLLFILSKRKPLNHNFIFEKVPNIINWKIKLRNLTWHGSKWSDQWWQLLRLCNAGGPLW